MMRLFLLNPTIVWQARVNAASFTYPLDEVAFDAETTGSYTDLELEQTILFGTTAGAGDLGRTRVRKDPISGTLYIGRSSQGIRDGEVNLQDNAYITALDDYRVWTKVPVIKTPAIDTVFMYKDSSFPMVNGIDGNRPPVANAGPGLAATDASGGGVQLFLDGSASFATGGGATIASYEWTLGSGDSFVNSVSSDPSITGLFAAGFRWVSLKVTDSNGNTHTARVPVYIRDPDNDDSIQEFEVTQHRITPEGQQLTVRVYEDISTFPDGTLAMLWDGEPANSTDQSHMVFCGWHEIDPASIAAQRTGNVTHVDLNLVDVAGRMRSLPAFPQTLENPQYSVDDDGNETIDAGATPNQWTEMLAPDMDKWLHYLIYWHSNVLTVADWTDTGVGSTYPFVTLGAAGASLWDQVAAQPRKMAPDYWLTCNRLGQLRTIVDPLVQASGNRTSTVQAALTEADLSEIRYTHHRPPRTHWLDGSGVLASNTSISAMLCQAPGTSPGMGAGKQVSRDRLAPSQGTLNTTIGNEHARINAEESLIDLRLSDGDDRGIEPADMTWVTVNLAAAYAAQRGLTFSNARGLVQEMNIRYSRSRTGVAKQIDLRWERETSGPAAVTILANVATTEPDTPGDFNGDDYFEDPENFPVEEQTPAELYYGNMKMYVLWDGARVFRTDNIQDASPTWEFVDAGVTGAIIDGEYVTKDDNTVGMWLLTEDAVWWCDDIMATTPSWDDVLTITTVRNNSTTPSSGDITDIVFGGMAQWHGSPGYLMVTVTEFETANTYDHAYVWHTHNFGATWAQGDINFSVEDFGLSRHYSRCSRYGITIHNDSGTIFCTRWTERVAGSGRTGVFKSDDLGDTWTKETDLSDESTSGASLLKPFPSLNDPSYLTTANGSGARDTDLYVSATQWATSTLRTNPSGYDYISVNRPNSHTYDANHIIGWWKRTDDGTYDILESFDAGLNWSLVWSSGIPWSGYESPFNTPNGWPPDPNQWVIVTLDGDLESIGHPPGVQWTGDNFATRENKEGNLATLLGGPDNWTNGIGNNGFALPRLQRNA